MTHSDDEWDLIQEDRSDGPGIASSGALRIALLFGSVAVAFALFLVPIMGRQGDLPMIGRLSSQTLDQMSTGSVQGRGAYVIRRSVLQNTPHSVCVIRADGRQTGDC
ncbi:MAG: hypothetical protein WCC66_05160 [Rhizobiaceae bacterium]